MIRSLEFWSVEVCAMAVLAALWRILFPDLRRYGVFPLLRIVMLLCVIRVLIPSAAQAIDALKSAEVPEIQTSLASDGYAEAVTGELSQSLLEKLQADGINARDVRIDFTITDEGIVLDGVALDLSSPADHPEELCASLSKEWDIPVRIAPKEEGVEP